MTAIGLRFGGIGGLSLCHFDEGIYVSSGMTVAADGWYSFLFAQPLQSPPLLPWIIGGLVWVTQFPWPIFGVLLTAAMGSASVPLFFLVARRWGGNTFGLVASTLLACSDFHVAYSRMALTDAPLTFWFLLAMYCVTRLKCQTESPFKLSSHGKRRSTKGQHSGPASRRPYLAIALWTLATTLAAAAAWNTKYNGWLVLAIPLFAALLWLGYQRIRSDRETAEGRQRFLAGGMLLGCLLLASLGAAASYVHWYLHVERHFPGGYQAVIDNHRRYFSGPTAWPAHAWSLVASLAALRHWGWIFTLALVVLGLSWRLLSMQRELTNPPVRGLPSLALWIGLVLGLGSVILIQGADAAILLLGAVGIVAALRSGSWPRLLAAVWGGTFLVLTPLYHPYPRLLLPALPACICLGLWLLSDVWPGWMQLSETSSAGQRLERSDSSRRRLAAGSLVAAATMSLFWLLGPHDFGLLWPMAGVWDRWTARQSYRAAEQAILRHTDEDSTVICQTQPLMILYCPRRPLLVENRSFATLMADVPAETDCFLMLDFCWLHGQPDQAALQGIQDQAQNLTSVAVIENDLNIVTLMDHLSPEQVRDKLAEPLPPYTLRTGEHSLPVPPSLSSPYQDTIVLYRVNLPLVQPGR